MKDKNTKAFVVAVSISDRKGDKKVNQNQVTLRKNYGIVGDAHAGSARQVSLLALESIEKMKAKGLKVKPGDFAENVTVSGIEVSRLKPGTKIKIGQQVLLEVTEIGKECHSRCHIYYQAGDCVMPREGVFARVLRGGIIKVGDYLELVE